MPPLYQIFQLFAAAMLAIVALAGAYTSDLLEPLLELEEAIRPHISVGYWLFAGCVLLWSSSSACRALYGSVIVVTTLIRELVFVHHDTTVAALKAQIESFMPADDVANTSSVSCGSGSKKALADQGEVVKELHKKVDKMSTKIAMYERHYNIAVVDVDRLNSQQTIAELELQRQTDSDEITQLHGAIQHKQTEVIAMQFSRRERNDLQNQLDAKMKRIEELELVIFQHDRDMHQRDAQVAKFDAFKEHMHIMVEAGGLQMLLTVLFLGAF